MPKFSFAIDWPAVLILLLAAFLLFIFWKWSSTFQKPKIFFSKPKELESGVATFRNMLSRWPSRFMKASIIILALAFIDPHFFISKELTENELARWTEDQIPSEGIAIYLVLDQSSSMNQAVSGRFFGSKITKMELLKNVTKDFVQGNPKLGLKGRDSDMIGLVAFARGANILSPLTLDHEQVIKKLDQLDYVKEDKLDGTAIGYAIFKTVNVIAATKHFAMELEENKKPAYDIKSSIIILVTDGFQSPSPLDKDKDLRNIELIEAAKYAKVNNVRLYIINVEPKMAADQYKAFRNLMIDIADITDGKFYLVDSTSGLENIYRDIDLLEKSKLPGGAKILPDPKDLPHIYQRLSLYPYLIFSGMCLLFLSIFLEGVIIRRVP